MKVAVKVKMHVRIEKKKTSVKLLASGERGERLTVRDKEGKQGV